jgi:sortase A
MKKRITTILLFVMLFVGLSLLLYPTVSDYWNSFHQSKMIASYADSVANLDENGYKEMLQQAQDYNKRLHSKENRWIMTDEEKREYESILDVTGTGIMGYIDIPEINVTLPIYHGTDEAVLQIAVGHLEGSTLPIGGVGNHSVVSGHRGLPSAKLFTNLDKLAEGDDFVIRVLNEVYTYEVDKIWIVEPNDLSPLTFDADKDYCTLVTCTPYGVNSHRLLVRGHRVENAKEGEVKVTADAVQIEPTVVAPIVAVPMLLILFIAMMVTTGKKMPKNKR